MAATDFAVRVAQDYEATRVVEYIPSQVVGETMIPGEFCVWDAGNAWVERAGADPTPIYGLCEVNSEAARVITENGKIPIRKLFPGVLLAMCSATQYVAATHKGVEYGIVRLASGHWAVDVSDTTAIRVVVEDGDVPTNVWYVRPLALHFDDSIVS